MTKRVTRKKIGTDTYFFLKKRKKIGVCPYFFVICISILILPAVTLAKSADRALVADFSSADLTNNLGGKSGTWELDPGDLNQICRASVDFANTKKKGDGCLKLEYDVDSTKHAVNGFWTQLPGFDASGFDHFEFYVKGDKEKGHTSSFKIELKKLKKVNGITSGDEAKGSFVVTGITGEWQKVSIPLHRFVGIEENHETWQDLKEFVITFESRRADKKTGVIYIDDVRFVKVGVPGPSIRDHIPRKAKTPVSLSGEPLARFLIKRLAGFPKKVWVKKDFPEDSEKFLKGLARDTWGYFDNIIDTAYGLPLDNIQLGRESAVSDKTFIGDYTNVTNIGLYLMCVVSAYDFGFISREDAVKRVSLTLDSVDKLERHNGFLYNYYDITTFQRTSHFISLVDSGWFTAGLVVVKNAFPEEFGKRCQAMMDARDFSFFYDPVEGYMRHGYYVNVESFSEYHYGIFYSEPRAISYLAIGKGDVPEEHWFMLNRTFAEKWDWQNQAPKGRKAKEYLGHNVDGGYYEYDGYKYVPSWGGSLFEALMPALIIDEKSLAPKGLGVNDSVHVKLHIKTAREKLKYPVWGMSPCTVPSGGYSEYGVKELGIKGYKHGVVTPHASFLALEFAPEEAIENLRNLIKLYNIYGEYGFYDSVDMETGLVAPKYLCLDQAMSFIALNNYLNDGAIRKRFHKDALNLKAEKLLGVEDFFN